MDSGDATADNDGDNVDGTCSYDLQRTGESVDDRGRWCD